MVQLQRIACLLPNLAGGGQERVTLNLLRGLTQYDLLLDLVVATAEGPYLDEIPETVRLINLERKIEDRTQSAIALISPLVRYLQQERPDVLFSHLVWTNEIAVVAKALARVPLRLILLEQMPASSKPTQRVNRWIKSFLTRSLYPHANAIVTPSQGVARAFERELNLKPNSIKTIYNPVVDETLMQKAETPISHPWRAEGEPPIILNAGRLAPQKDFSTSIEAFARLREQREARLIILGEGALRGKLEALVKKLGLEGEVLLPGFVKNPYAYMSLARVFVLSSRWEGLPTVLIEAIACGCQIVSTDCPHGPQEILAGGEYGRLVPVGEVAALREGIELALDNPIAPEKLVARSRDFSVQQSAAQYFKLARGE
ncbi:glycosyltransferase [Lusitaniella coriacea]|uniref:glycosyltransferase n=1 Tax=Lusitaniella coriacea TaxID=1983105 RepID=UPI003CEE84B8